MTLVAPNMPKLYLRRQMPLPDAVCPATVRSELVLWMMSRDSSVMRPPTSKTTVRGPRDPLWPGDRSLLRWGRRVSRSYHLRAHGQRLMRRKGRTASTFRRGAGLLRIDGALPNEPPGRSAHRTPALMVTAWSCFPGPLIGQPVEDRRVGGVNRRGDRA